MQPDYYPGLFKGIVQDNNDPAQLCRLRVYIPEVHGDPSSTNDYPWALACLPYGGDHNQAANAGFGMVFIPPIKSTVWVSFEHGQLDKPVWLGCPYLNTAVKSPETPVQVLGPEPNTGAVYPNIAIIKPLAVVDESNYLVFGYNPATKSYGLRLVLDAANSIQMYATWNTATGQYTDTLQITGNNVVNLTCKDVTGTKGQINLTAGQAISISAPALNLTSTGAINITGKSIQTSSTDGSTILSVDKNHTLQASAKNVSGFKS